MTTIIATVDATMARVFITVTGAVGTTGTINRVDTAGVQRPIRGGDPAIFSGGGFSGYDYEAALDESVYYQVLDVSGAVVAASPLILVPSNDNTWLKNPGRPDRNVILSVVELPQLDYDIPQGVFKVIGSQFPVVVSSARWAATGSITAFTGTMEARQAMLDLLTDGSVLLLQAPAAYGIGSLYVSVGQVSEARLVRLGFRPGRLWTLPITVVEAPVGLASAGVGNAWSDVISTYATWNATDSVMAAKTSWAALIERVAS